MKKLLILLFTFVFLGCDNKSGDTESSSWVNRIKDFEYLIDNEKYQQALQLASEQVQLAEEGFPKSRHLADWYNNLGLAYFYLHQYENALKYLGESQKLAYEKKISTATAHRNLALVYSNLNKYSLAESYIRSALKGYAKERVVDSSSIVHSKIILARILINQRDLDSSTKFINDVLSYGKRQNDSSFVTSALSIQVNLYMHTGQYEIALEHLRKLQDYYKRKQKDELYANGLNNIGSIYYLNKNFRKAIEYFDSAAIFNYSVFGDSAMLGRYMKNISHAYKVSGDSINAQKYWDTYNRIKR